LNRVVYGFFSVFTLILVGCLELVQLRMSD